LIAPGFHPRGYVPVLGKSGSGQVQALTVLGPARWSPAGEEKRRGDPSCCLEALSSSYTHFTGVGMWGLEGSPAELTSQSEVSELTLLSELLALSSLEETFHFLVRDVVMIRIPESPKRQVHLAPELQAESD